MRRPYQKGIAYVVHMSTINKAEIVQICQNALSMENSLLLAYRGLFLTIEAVALAVAAVLISVRASQLTIVTRPAIVVLAIISFFIAGCWYWQVGQRTQIVDEWKARIYDHTRKTEISAYFDTYNQTRLHIRSIRLWLDIIAPVSVVIFWVILLWLGCYS